MSKITDSAMGEECSVRICGICNFDNSTTIFAHLNGAGVALKAHDSQGAYCCSNCHAVLDGHQYSEYSQQELLLMHYEGILRTQLILFKKGLLVVVGACEKKFKTPKKV